MKRTNFEDLSGMSKIGSLALKKIVSASSLVYVGYNVWGNAANLAFGRCGKPY